MRHALITGGSAGIGFSLVRKFIEAGYFVYNLDIKKSAFEHSNHMYVPCDVKDAAQVEKALKQVKTIDVLINNAAIQYVKPFKETTMSDWDDVIKTNLNGVFHVTRLSLEKMNKGYILNVGSVHGALPREMKMAYDVSKAGLIMFTKELALELAKDQIRVNCINIGATVTPMNDDFTPEDPNYQASIEKIPLRKVFSSQEIADVIYKMITEFPHMTGSVLTYDAGRSLN